MLYKWSSEKRKKIKKENHEDVLRRLNIFCNRNWEMENPAFLQRKRLVSSLLLSSLWWNTDGHGMPCEIHGPQRPGGPPHTGNVMLVHQDRKEEASNQRIEGEKGAQTVEEKKKEEVAENMKKYHKNFTFIAS